MKPNGKISTFRVHMDDGQVFEIDADSPDAAREIVKREIPKAVITKTKVLKAGAA